MTKLRHGGRPWSAVVGRPVTHSLSPHLHGAASEALGQDLEYTRLDVGAEEFPEALTAARQDPRWRGFSVTMPLKSEAFAAADRRTRLAEAVGTVNTLVPDPAAPASDRPRPLLGHNTDVAGIRDSLLAAGLRARPGLRAGILGGGGTSTAAAAALRELGAERCTVWVRDPGRAGRLVAAAERTGLDLDFRALADFGSTAAGHDLIVSTLPARAADPSARELPSGDRALARTTLLDAAYDPWPSELARAVARAGGTVVSGMEMLLHQAVDQAKLFLGLPLELPLPHQQDVLAAMAAAVGLPSPAGASEADAAQDVGHRLSSGARERTQ